MTELVKISELFEIEYGNQLDKNKLDQDEDGINFVSRSTTNLGVNTKIAPLDSLTPYPEGLITVTLGGTYLLSAFIQPAPFYTAQNIKVLRPKTDMTFIEKLFYCNAISHNRFRYTSHGREANKTFDSLMVPSIPQIPT